MTDGFLGFVVKLLSLLSGFVALYRALSAGDFLALLEWVLQLPGLVAAFYLEKPPGGDGGPTIRLDVKIELRVSLVIGSGALANLLGGIVILAGAPIGIAWLLFGLPIFLNAAAAAILRRARGRPITVPMPPPPGY